MEGKAEERARRVVDDDVAHELAVAIEDDEPSRRRAAGVESRDVKVAVPIRRDALGIVVPLRERSEPLDFAAIPGQGGERGECDENECERELPAGVAHGGLLPGADARRAPMRVGLRRFSRRRHRVSSV